MRAWLPAVAAALAAAVASVPGRAAAQSAQSAPPAPPFAPSHLELLPLDEAAKGNFSLSAARASDTTLALAVAVPLALQVGQGFDRASGARALVFGEAVAVTVVANAVTKRLVGRPRPYAYNRDPRVEAYAGREGRDARLSFYSGHAATTFAAAVAGGYLYALHSDDTAARTAAWASGLALAGATATLRVRAGKHFPSDVLVGALVGAGVGWAVPALALHLGDGAPPSLAPSEWIAIAAAPIAGAVLAALVPMPSDISEPLVVPWLSERGGGVVFARRF